MPPLLLSYNLLWTLALPAAFARLVWRSCKQPAYREHWGERTGRYAVRAPGRTIWVHAVSLGETRAAEPLVRALLEGYPEHSIVLTHMTPTGRAASNDLFAGNARVLKVYLPYDFAPFVARFLDHFRPSIGIVMETELWPTLIHACQRRGIPTLLANARLSERSARRYAKLPALARPLFGALTAVGAQSAADAQRLKALGAKEVVVTGNIKFDVDIPPEASALASTFRACLGNRPTILAASTREGEEALILEAFLRTAPANPDAMLIIAPRHPQRFDDVAELIRARGLPVARRSEGCDTPLPPEIRVWLGDTMGEMPAYYAAADVSLIGGSWLPFGGQNLIEACAVGTPVLLGPHTFNFQRVAEDAVEMGAARRLADVEEAITTAFALLKNPTARAEMSEAGRAFAAANRGATARTVALINYYI